MSGDGASLGTRRRAVSAFVVIAVLVGSMALVSGTADATFRGANGVIAVAYTFNFNEGPTAPEWGLFTVESSGRSRHRLRQCDTFGTCDQWADVSYSPNGRKLAWDISPSSGLHVIVANADGTNAITVAAGFDPSFSPSGTQLLFVRQHGHEDQIVLRTLLGRAVRVLLTIPSASYPEMSPDGQQIVFVHGRTIWLMNANGTGREPIIPDGGTPSWSPSGTELAYVGTKSGRPYTALANGTDRRELPLPVKDLCYPPACGGGSTFAVFSPDGTKIAFDNTDGSGDPTVFVVAVHGGNPKQIASVNTDSAGGSVDGLSWQPGP